MISEKINPHSFVPNWIQDGIICKNSEMLFNTIENVIFFYYCGVRQYFIFPVNKMRKYKTVNPYRGIFHNVQCSKTICRLTRCCSQFSHFIPKFIFNFFAWTLRKFLAFSSCPPLHCPYSTRLRFSFYPLLLSSLGCHPLSLCELASAANPCIDRKVKCVLLTINITWGALKINAPPHATLLSFPPSSS